MACGDQPATDPVSHTDPFQSFFDLANQGFAITAPDTRWLHVNASICHMLGYTEEELRRLTWVELTHPEDRAPDLQQFHRLVAGHIDDYQLNKRFVRKDGSLLHARLTVSVLRDAACEPVQINATLLDRTEEQQALDALRLSEERFLLLADSTLDGIWDWDLTAETLWLSRSWKAQLGYADAEVENRFETFPDMMHPDDRPRVMEHLRAYLAEPADVWQETFRLHHKDGSWRQIMARAIAVVRDERIERLVGVHVDITAERVAVEQLKAWSEELENNLKLRGRELAEREALYRNIADYTVDWETWTDAGGTLRYCSPACQRISAYPADAFLEDAGLIERIVHPEDRAVWIQHRARLVAPSPETIGTASISFRILRADGEVRWLERVDHPMHTDDGSYAGIRASIRDITQIRTTQAELERQKDFIEAIVSTARAVILVLGPRAEVVEVNPYLEEVSGWRAKELIDRNWIDTCVPSEQRETARRVFAQAWTDERTHGVVAELLTKSGDIRHLRWYDEMLDAPNDDARLLVAVGVDVTDQLVAEQARQRLNEQLEQKVAERTRALEVTTAAMIQSEKLGTVGTMVAGLAHEINNPLMGLGNYVDYAREHTEGRVQEMLGKANAQIERISRILTNLLQYARPASGESHESLEMVSAARHAADLAAADLRHRNIELVDRLPDRLPCVRAEAGPLQQVILNLLINARDALSISRETSDAVTHPSAPAPVVTLEGGVRTDGDGARQWAWIEVRDNGPGVPAKIHHSVFDPFFTTKSRGRGTGLGLSVSLGIVTGYDGELTLRQPDAGGAAFRIELPTVAEDDCTATGQTEAG